MKIVIFTVLHDWLEIVQNMFLNSWLLLKPGHKITDAHAHCDSNRILVSGYLLFFSVLRQFRIRDAVGNLP